MFVCFVTMIHILVLFRTLLAAEVLTLSIDSHLGTSVEDCFERIAIGEQLPASAIYRNVSELTTRECEQICKQDKQCQAYDYGVGAKGNATCNLSNTSEKELKERSLLIKNPDYDVYVRRIQCEQSPPSPLTPQFDSESHHKPVFRPDADEKRPVEDYAVFDLKPYETSRPNYRPYTYNYIDDRPDDYNTKPVYDRPPSYGHHKPQEIPYKPQWRPDPVYPPEPDDIPDIYGTKPVKRPYVTEKPAYVYFTRPPRPKPSYQYKPQIDYPTKPDPYGPGPVGPPSRPKPTYDYQYASNYGQNQDNSIYLEIYDPPRPQKPGYGSQSSGYGSQSPGYGSQSSGYGSQSHEYGSQSSGYGPQIYPSHSSHYGQDSSDYRPLGPSYGSASQSSGYGGQDYHTTTYRPKTIYGTVTHNSGYGEQNHYHLETTTYRPKPVYSSITESPGYGSQIYYERPQISSTSRPSKPAYGTGSHSSGYGGQSQDYRPHKPSYTDVSQISGYGQNHYQETNTYRPSKPSYSPSTERPSYGGSSDYISGESDIYKPSKPYPSSTQSPSYGGSNDYSPGYEKPSHQTPLYTFTKPQNSYGLSESSYGSRPNQEQHYIQKPYRPIKPHGKPDDNRPDGDYGFHQDIGPSYGDHKPQIPLPKPDNIKPAIEGYGNVKPVYENEYEKPVNVPSYVVRPSGEVVTSNPVAVGSYGSDDAPGYGRDPDKGVSYAACFRRVLAGKRALRSFVKRVIPCERLEDCRIECAFERRFHCESFNYRLDPSFHSKGLCELMTTPIEEFDIRRDFVEDKNYDFYEVDRNSLEPHCPETLRGPGLLHSGYLSSKPRPNPRPDWNKPGYTNNRWSKPGSSSGWMDRLDWMGDRFNGNRYGGNTYGGGRHDEPYVPYQIGLARTDDESPPLSYGYDTYYKDRNDYHKSMDYWGIDNKLYKNHNLGKPQFNYHDLGKPDFNHEVGSYGRSWVKPQNYGGSWIKPQIDGGSWVKPRIDEGSWKRGRWNTSIGWNGLDYGASHYYNKPKPYVGVARSDPDVKDCSSRRRPGMSLGSDAIKRALFARTVVDCETACFGETEFKCVSYSYRYSSNYGTDNCFLSELPYRGLDLSADSGSDVYAMAANEGCEDSQKTWVESECFWHVRSGAAVSAGVAVSVSGLGECEARCIRHQLFFCRGFSFRFDAPPIGDDINNCILTSSPPTSLSTNHGLRASEGHELYARGNYGRGCEPALYDDQRRESGECYLQYDNAAKLRGTSVRGRATVTDEQSCAEACTGAPFTCYSFSYNNNLRNSENCLLSDVRLFDLQRGVDYEPSTDDWLFAFDLFNAECMRRLHPGVDEGPTPELPRPFAPPEVPHRDSRPSGPSGPSGPPSGLPSGPSGLSGPPSGPSYLPAPIEPAYISGPPSGPGYKPPYLPERPNYHPERPGYLPERPNYPQKPEYLPENPGHPGYPQKPHLDDGFHPVYPVAPSDGFKPGFPPPQYPEPGYRPRPDSGYGRPGLRPGSKPGYPIDKEEPMAPWREYSVSGLPCRAPCAQNSAAGYWACEPEAGEIGSWDYCCAPTHRCGYSEGFHKPWCFVGPSEDQWRPCSDKYYPYHQHSVPHPAQGTQGYREPSRPSRPWSKPYLPEADRRYWNELYNNGPKAYYDNYGNPLPGYSRVPMTNRPNIKYHHNYPSAGQWTPSPLDNGPSPLGAPRYWPVAYLHKGPPPNVTYFKYNETDHPTTENYDPKPPLAPKSPPPKDDRPSIFTINPDRPSNNNLEGKSLKDDNNNTISNITKDFEDLNKGNNNDSKVKTKDAEIIDVNKVNQSDSSEIDKSMEEVKGINGKIDDLTNPIEVLDIEDAKSGEKSSDLKTLEAEEKQIEAIGRLLASRRGGQIILEKRSQKDLETKNIAIDKDLSVFNFGNRFPTTERKGIIQKVTKADIEREKNVDKSLEVSETTFVRPPRVLSTTGTTDNIRKAVVNGKVFYDATIREQRDLFNNSTRKPKNLRSEDLRGPSVFANANFGKKKAVRVRNVTPPVNPVRKVRRVYRRKYNPEEVRRRLLEREKNKDSKA